MSFRLVPNSVTLNDLERRNGRYTVLFHWILVNLRSNTTASVRIELTDHLYSKHCDRPMSCDEARRPVAEFICQSIAFCSTCTMSSLKSLRSLSHLLMSFLWSNYSVQFYFSLKSSRTWPLHCVTCVIIVVIYSLASSSDGRLQPPTVFTWWAVPRSKFFYSIRHHAGADTDRWCTW